MSQLMNCWCSRFTACTSSLPLPPWLNMKPGCDLLDRHIFPSSFVVTKVSSSLNRIVWNCDIPSRQSLSCSIVFLFCFFVFYSQATKHCTHHNVGQFNDKWRCQITCDYTGQVIGQITGRSAKDYRSLSFLARKVICHGLAATTMETSGRAAAHSTFKQKICFKKPVFFFWSN